MKVAIYVRVSTDEQAEEGYSIAAQRDRLLAFCMSQGWEVVGTYIDDGVSAKDLERPELKRLLNDMESALFDVVLVYRLDRLTRSVIDLYTLLQRFERHNVKFKSATEVYDTTTAMGRLFITLVAALAQWERENLGERVRFGMEQMVREGKRPGGPVPFGYAPDGITVIEEEKEICRELRRLYMVERLGFRSIAVNLNQRGMLKRGEEWAAQTVWYVLDNPFYAGKIRWGERNKKGTYTSRKKEDHVNCIYQDGQQETIFTWEEYEEHTLRMKRRSFNGYTKVREYWFAGVLRCAKCGSRMTGRYHQNKRQDGSYRKILSYICANRQQGKGCTMPMFRQELVEHLLMEYLRKIKLDFGKMEDMSAEATVKNDDVKREVEKLRAELRKVEERSKKWQYMFVEDLITADDLRKRKAEDQMQREAIENRITELSNMTEEVNEHKQMMIDLLDMWDVLEDGEKNDIIQTIFADIILDTPLERAHGRKGQFIPSSIVEVKYN